MRSIGDTYRKPGRNGWWVRWTDPAVRKRITRNFHTKELAEQFRAAQYHRLNSGIFALVEMPLADVMREYLGRFDMVGLAKKSKAESKRTLEGLLGTLPATVSATKLAQCNIDSYITTRVQAVSKASAAKDCRNIRAFLRWASHRSRRYLAEGLEVPKIKVPLKMVKALTVDQVRSVLASCPTPEWKLRVILSLTTGLRSSDVDRLPSQVDMVNLSIDTTSRKTGRSYVGRPLPDAIRPMLEAHLKHVVGPQLFSDVNVRKTWERIRKGSGMPHLTRHEFRRTFATLMQMGSSGAARTLLEHSSQKLTTDYYTDSTAVLRYQVNHCLPVAEWLGDLKV